MFVVELTTCMYMAVDWHAKRYEQLTLHARKDAGGLTLHVSLKERAEMMHTLFHLCAVELAAQRIQ